jgi:hypothetical protein
LQCGHESILSFVQGGRDIESSRFQVHCIVCVFSMGGRHTRYFIMVTSIAVMSRRVLRLLLFCRSFGKTAIQGPVSWSGTVGGLSNTGLRGYNQDIHWYIRALEEAVLRDTRHGGSASSKCK